MAGKSLTLQNMNPRLRDMEYAVRGKVPMRAEEIQKEITSAEAEGRPNPYPFSKVLKCNVGNPQAMGQPPITFYRQVLSLLDSPGLLASAAEGGLSGIYPDDVVKRAAELSAVFPGGTGAYTHSQGVELVRRHISEFIEKRDQGPPCRPENIFLANGASSAIQSMLTTMIAGPDDGVMVPIPQYPLYSALIKLLGGKQIGYYLDEASDWSLSVAELKRSIREAREQGVNPRAFVLINPGNPTGQVLTAECLEQVIRFCKEERLVLLADEVYQENIYVEGQSFVSARKVAASLQPELSDVELVSFHSTSKGLIGECGRRGGYMELWGIDPHVHAQLYKLQSSQLCPNTSGQAAMDLLVHPPQPGDDSYPLFKQETGQIYDALRRKSRVLVQKLNEIKGISCNTAAGALYTFVKVQLPDKAVEVAATNGMAPDLMYCMSLLESTGIVAIPGSGFGQRAGEYHFRMTFLPPEDQLCEAVSSFEAFHKGFVAEYS